MAPAADDPLDQGFQLDGLAIDPRTGEATGPGGCEKLDPKVVDVLLVLARRPGQVVPREELLALAWPDGTASDEMLSRCIYELRRQLSLAGNDEQLKALIETVPKRGYRLNARIAVPEPAPAARATKPRRLLRLALPVAAAVAAVGIAAWLASGRDPDGPGGARTAPASANSIAVLPFLDLSESQDQEHFADGIAEEILDRLDQPGGPRVIARTSSFAFRDKSRDIREIASQLGVTHVLEGSVRQSGDRIRITAQLISASDNAHLWSTTFDRKLGDLFAVQDEIATAVASALQISLDGIATTTDTPTRPEAYEPFLRGRFFYNRRAPGDIERSVKYFREALAIDPGYAKAWAALAGAYNLLKAQDRKSTESWLELQGEAAHKAVELGPGLAVAHARLAQYYFGAANRQKGSEHFQIASALDPNDPLVQGFSGDRAVRQGDLEGAVLIWRQLVDRNPLSYTDRSNLASFLASAGRLEESVGEYRRALELNPDARWPLRFDLVRALVQLRRHDEAVTEALLLPAGQPRDFAIAMLHAVPGFGSEADAALQRLAALPLDLESIRLAEIYAFRGMHEEAMGSLEAIRAALENSTEIRLWAIAQIDSLRSDLQKSRYLRPLHSDPRWARLMFEPAGP